MPRIIGIDHGEKNIGVAITDELKIIVKPLKTIENKSKNYILSQLKEICHEEDVEKIVIGFPVMLSGEEGIQVEKVNKFGEILKNKLKIPVEFEDERLSSVEAEKLLKENKEFKKIDRDQLAAYYILKAYVDKNY
jgi:putative holliday junction resolvase